MAACGSSAGKGRGKGAPPPLPKDVAKPPPTTAAGVGPKLKVCEGGLRSAGSTVVTSVDGTRRVEHADGTVEVLERKKVSVTPHHGRLAQPGWPAPTLAVYCDAAARPGYREGAAHEFLDDEDVLRAKVALLAEMLRCAKHTVVYAGAGLSTSSGIADYATRTGQGGVLGQSKGQSKGKGKNVVSSSGPASFYTARPNFGHRTLAALADGGLLWRLVQQNHDGLPQKAGVPQRIMNEIHGAIYDPSNPIVKMSGNLRNDLFADLLLCERKADLVLTLGSSLAGMNSDRLVLTCSERAQQKLSPPVHGSVIVALQTTPHDASASVRIYATIDRTMELLAECMGLSVPVENPEDAPTLVLPEVCRPLGPPVDVFEVPYDEEGSRLPEGSLPQRWDLRERSIHTVTDGPQKGCRAIILGKTPDGHYRVGIRLFPESTAEYHDIRLLGNWWIAAAVRGDVSQLPLKQWKELVNRAEPTE